MIRFRNPSSSLETMLASFDQLYSELAEKKYFDNDDIAEVLAKANLMASSGFTGDAALSLGANKDRSRDKTYNNAKMFAEIYRLLGLISTVNNVSSNYRFTFIGEHMVVPNADKKAIVEQCILGMNNPNKIMDVSYDESVRFFSCVFHNQLLNRSCRSVSYPESVSTYHMLYKILILCILFRLTSLPVLLQPHCVYQVEYLFHSFFVPCLL